MNKVFGSCDRQCMAFVALLQVEEESQALSKSAQFRRSQVGSNGPAAWLRLMQSSLSADYFTEDAKRRPVGGACWCTRDWGQPA